MLCKCKVLCVLNLKSVLLGPTLGVSITFMKVYKSHICHKTISFKMFSKLSHKKKKKNITSEKLRQKWKGSSFSLFPLCPVCRSSEQPSPSLGPSRISYSGCTFHHN